MAIRVRVNILQFCSVSNSLSHTNHSNKVRGIFLKKSSLVFIHWVNIYSACICDFLSSPSYIIFQSPIQYLWNGMFDRHQAEITVMQFTGHCLPVHQSMTVTWDFTLSHFTLSPTRFLPITAIRMCHLLLVHHFGMACLAGSKVNIQQYLLGWNRSFGKLAAFWCQKQQQANIRNNT